MAMVQNPQDLQRSLTSNRHNGGKKESTMGKGWTKLVGREHVVPQSSIKEGEDSLIVTDKYS